MKKGWTVFAQVSVNGGGEAVNESDVTVDGNRKTKDDCSKQGKGTDAVSVPVKGRSGLCSRTCLAE